MRKREASALSAMLVVSVIFGILAGVGADSAGRSGDSQTGCGGCHGSTQDLTVSVTLSGIPSAYVPGKTYRITITVSGPRTGTYGGFDLSVTAGRFSNAGPNAQIVSNVEVTHSGATADTWTVDWTAPPVGTGSVTFYVAGLEANGDSKASKDDGWRLKSYTSIENRPPQVALSYPNGLQDWTGGSPHKIWWDMNDTEDPNTDLLVFLNYSYNGGASTGQIAGSIAGTANPNSYTWNLPYINATDVVVNITVVDKSGTKGFDEKSIPIIDSRTPTIISVDPSEDASGVPTNTNIVVRWNETMNTVASGSYQSFGLQNTNDGKWVAGSFSWNLEGNVMTFNPSQDLAPSTLHRAYVNTTSKDDSDPGNALSAQKTWTFITSLGADITPPQITNVKAEPSPQESGGNVNISADVTDNFGVAGVWVNITFPSGNSFNQSMTRAALNSWFYNRSYSELGSYSFAIWASDTSGNWNRSSGGFLVQDTIPPQITGAVAIPSVQETGGNVNITAIVKDNYALSGVWVNVTAPVGPGFNKSMLPLPSDKWYWEQPYSDIGTHTFVMWAKDATDHWSSSRGLFVIQDTAPPSITYSPITAALVGNTIAVSATVVDNVGVTSVKINYTDVTGAVHNDSMSLVSGNNYSYTISPQNAEGFVSYFLWAIDGSGNSARTALYTIAITSGPKRPSSPSNLMVSTSQERGTLDISWTAPVTNEDGTPLTNLLGFNLYRSRSAGGPYVRVNSGLITGTTYVDKGLEEGTTYYYVVTAVNSLASESAFSEEKQGTTRKVDSFSGLVFSFSLDSMQWLTPVIAAALLLLLLMIVILKRTKSRVPKGRKEKSVASLSER